MAKRWVIGGLAVGVGALVMAPEARTWLRRRLGLEPEDRRWFEEDGVDTAEHEGDEPLDTREARYSLRARLAEEGHAEPGEAPAPAPAPPPFAEPVAAEPVVEEPVAEEPVVEEPVAEEPVVEEPVAEEPVIEESVPEEPVAPPPTAWAPAPAPAPAPVFEAPVPEPDPEYISYEALPAIVPEADAPRAPGEDTNEIEPVGAAPEPEAAAEEGVEEEEPPPPPPTLLRPPTSPGSPPPNRPFGESTSFRHAIDAARERVHGAARDATPSEGEDGDEADERA